jgi:hypothetical protein
LCRVASEICQDSKHPTGDTSLFLQQCPCPAPAINRARILNSDPAKAPDLRALLPLCTYSKAVCKVASCNV